MVCLDVFGRPEVPRHYDLLRAIGRLPELRRFAPAEAPMGTVMNAQALHAKFAALTEDEIGLLRARWLRDFIMNFSDPLGTVYVEGDFEILHVRPLREGDFIANGALVKARAMVKPDEFTEAAPYPVTVEWYLPSEDPRICDVVSVGDRLTLAKSDELSVIIGVSRGKEDGVTTIQLQVVPLAYAIRAVDGRASAVLAPPAHIRPAGLLDGGKHQAEIRRGHPKSEA